MEIDDNSILSWEFISGPYKSDTIGFTLYGTKGIVLSICKLFLCIHSLMKMAWKPGNVRRIPLSIIDSMQDLENHFKFSELAFSTCEVGQASMLICCSHFKQSLPGEMSPTKWPVCRKFGKRLCKLKFQRHLITLRNIYRCLLKKITSCPFPLLNQSMLACSM